MSVTATRSWVPLNIKHSDAVSRGLWGCEEMGISVSDPQKELVLLEIRFSALGLGYFLMDYVLTTQDWKKFRFYGELPLRCVNQDGQTMFEVLNDLLIIE